LSCFADGKGFAIGSIEGRCGIQNVNFNKPPKDCCENDFCFKCHRKEQGNDGDAFTVNKISFNKQHNTFATVGGDGTYIIWNKDTKARYRQSPVAKQSMTAVCFSEDASILVFAVGEDYNKGHQYAQSRPNNVKLYCRKTEKDDVFKIKK